jgi:hypothetical protein
LDFSVFAGGMEMNYLIMKNENALIGLFHGMFEDNIITFNPDWDENANKLDSFNDVREIQQGLKSQNVTLISEADETTADPENIILVDPDGNQILIDQQV